MAQVKRVRKKDIQQAKRPDALLTKANSLFDWLWARRVVSLSVLAGVLVLVAVVTGLRAYGQARAHRVGVELSSAVGLTARPVGPADSTGGAKTFQTQADKQQAVSRALGKLIQDHPGTAGASAAALLRARDELDHGKTDDAIRDYQAYLKNDDGRLALFAHEGLGYAYEAKHDWAKALDAFGKLAEDGVPARALYHEARVLAEEGKKDEARKDFEEVIAKYQTDVVASDARARLDLLDLPPAGVGALSAPSSAPDASAVPEPAKKVANPHHPHHLRAGTGKKTARK